MANEIVHSSYLGVSTTSEGKLGQVRGDAMAGFGFTPEDSSDPEKKPDSSGSFGDFFQQFSNLGINLQAVMAALSGKSTPANLSRELIRDISRKFLAAHGELPITVADLEATKRVMNIADLWLNEATAFPALPLLENCALSRREWIDSTLLGWEELALPLVEGMSEAMSTIFNEALGDATEAELGEQLRGLTGFGPANIPKSAVLAMMGTFVSSLISSQLGQTIGNLATTVTGANDVALPLTGEIKAQLIPQNLANWGSGLDIDANEVGIYLALRELAAARLFAAAPWLRQQIKAAIASYGKGIRIDITAITEQAQQAFDSGQLDFNNPESMTFALSGGLFTPEESETQRAALSNLENILALIEGWIDAVVIEAAGARLPALTRLREAQQRRRATNSPTQQLFASLIGLEVSPRKAREASKFWQDFLSLSDQKTRDEIWSESFLIPSPEQLGDAASFLRSRTIPDDLSGLI